jgi:hypothetical protein
MPLEPTLALPVISNVTPAYPTGYLTTPKSPVYQKEEIWIRFLGHGEPLSKIVSHTEKSQYTERHIKHWQVFSLSSILQGKEITWSSATGERAL